MIVTSLKSEFGKVRIIPQNMEKYLSISVGRIKLLDSFQFTPPSLDVLSKTLEGDEFKYLSESCISDSFELVRRKGVYPYDYMYSFERFEETEVPSQGKFFNKLSGDTLGCLIEGGTLINFSDPPPPPPPDLIKTPPPPPPRLLIFNYIVARRAVKKRIRYSKEKDRTDGEADTAVDGGDIGDGDEIDDVPNLFENLFE